MNARNEGNSGVQNLARLCRVIGYKDTQYFGQFDQDGSYGDLIEFLSDNMGAIELIKGFIEDNFPNKFNENFEEMSRIFNDSNLSWEEKYELIFSLDRPDFEYYDPDTSYEEDVIALVRAWTEYKNR